MAEGHALTCTVGCMGEGWVGQRQRSKLCMALHVWSSRRICWRHSALKWYLILQTSILAATVHVRDGPQQHQRVSHTNTPQKSSIGHSTRKMSAGNALLLRNTCTWGRNNMFCYLKVHLEMIARGRGQNKIVQKWRGYPARCNTAETIAYCKELVQDTPLCVESTEEKYQTTYTKMIIMYMTIFIPFCGGWRCVMYRLQVNRNSAVWQRWLWETILGWDGSLLVSEQWRRNRDTWRNFCLCAELDLVADRVMSQEKTYHLANLYMTALFALITGHAIWLDMAWNLIPSTDTW